MKYISLELQKTTVNANIQIWGKGLTTEIVTQKFEYAFSEFLKFRFSYYKIYHFSF